MLTFLWLFPLFVLALSVLFVWDQVRRARREKTPGTKEWYYAALNRKDNPL